MTEPWSIAFLRKEWVDKITEHRRFETDQTKQRATVAESRYVFAWRRWRQSLLGRPRLHAVKHRDPAVGWQVLRP